MTEREKQTKFIYKRESLNDELKYSEDSAAATLEIVKTKEKESKHGGGGGGDCFPSFDLGVPCDVIWAAV